MTARRWVYLVAAALVWAGALVGTVIYIRHWMGDGLDFWLMVLLVAGGWSVAPLRYLYYHRFARDGGSYRSGARPSV
jgi:hypothetical protein